MKVKVARKGSLIVVSAPSGAGKSTLCNHLLSKRRNLVLSISATTRLPRPGEKDGTHYFFVSEPAFRAMRDRGDFLEWAEVHGQCYGTPRANLERLVAAGKDVILEIDVQGALQVKRRYPDAVLIFINTQTFEELEKRLRRRHSEPEADIRRRLATARREIQYVNRYDYLVINDRIPRALRDLETILNAVALRAPKPPQGDTGIRKERRTSQGDTHHGRPVPRTQSIELHSGQV